MRCGTDVLSLNVGSAFRFCRAVSAAMKAKRYGKIVNVSSTLANGMFGAAGTVGARIPYVTAKSAIIGLTKQLAKDLGPFGVAVNAIAPGFTLRTILSQTPRRGSPRSSTHFPPISSAHWLVIYQWAVRETGKTWRTSCVFSRRLGIPTSRGKFWPSMAAPSATSFQQSE